MHREDGPAIEYVNGDCEWLINGITHREDGPAYTSLDDYYRAYYKNGLRHREDGPAIVFRDGSVLYYVYGVQMNVDEFNEWKIQTFLKGI